MGAARFLESVLQPDREDELTDVPDELWSRLIKATSRLGVEDNTTAIERAAAVAHARRRI